MTEVDFNSGRSRYIVYVDGVEFSRHTTEREAAQNAANQALSNSSSSVHYTHLYDVIVTTTGEPPDQSLVIEVGAGRMDIVIGGLSVRNGPSLEVDVTGAISWVKPTTDAVGNSLLPGVITGYKVYVDNGGGFSLSEEIVGENNTSSDVALNVGERVAVATTWAGGQSPLSFPVTKEADPGVILTVGAGQTYTDLQDALDVANPGDTIRVKGGTYTHVGGVDTWYTFSRSGTAGNPITVEPFPGEHVIFEGRAAASPFPNDGLGTQPSDPGEELFNITGDYWTIRGFELKDSNRYGVRCSGSNVTLEYLYIHNIWERGVLCGSSGALNTFRGRFLEVHHCLHHTGLIIDPLGSATTTSYHDDCRYEWCLSYYNGYLESAGADNEQATGVQGDDPAGDFSVGGGNSDIGGVGKNALPPPQGKAASGDNLAPNAMYKGVIGFRCADDSFDWSPGNGSKMIGTVAFHEGPQGRRGYKVLGNVDDADTPIYQMLGTMALGTTDGFRGYELRAANHNDAELYNVTAWQRTEAGIRNNMPGASEGSMVLTNSLSWNNSSNDFLQSTTQTTNYLNDEVSAPDIENVSFTRPTNLTLPTTYTMTDYKKRFWSRWHHIMDQVQQNMMPTSGGNLHNAGTFVAGVHTVTPADDATSPADPDADLMQWTGSAPDIGAIPYVYINPPREVEIS